MKINDQTVLKFRNCLQNSRWKNNKAKNKINKNKKWKYFDFSWIEAPKEQFQYI